MPDFSSAITTLVGQVGTGISTNALPLVGLIGTVGFVGLVFALIKRSFGRR
jgi:hypothetical protein